MELINLQNNTAEEFIVPTVKSGLTLPGLCRLINKITRTTVRQKNVCENIALFNILKYNKREAQANANEDTLPEYGYYFKGRL